MAAIVSIDSRRSARVVEFLAAATVSCLTLVVLYLVFVWKPF
jgi:hypothetical protein